MFILFWVFRLVIGVLIAVAFARLSLRYHKNKIIFSALGLFAFALGFVIGITALTTAQKAYPNSSIIAAALKWSGIVFGLVFAATLYSFLRRKWDRVLNR